MQPKVSVLIPCYNAAAFLDQSIQSVLDQTFTDFELIIVDNASEDGTPQLVKKYLTDPRVQYFRNEVNIGMSGNFNRCLTLAKGIYIKFLMADDLFHPHLLDRFVAVMDAHPKVTIVTSYRYLLSESGQAKVFETPFKGLQQGKSIICATLNDWNWIGEPTTVMFRSKNLNLGLFNPEYHYYLDWDMWLRHLGIGDCYFIPEPLSYFRMHGEQTSMKIKQNYSLYFEEYRFFKSIKTVKPHYISNTTFNPHHQIKNKSLTLVKIGLKLLWKLKVKEWQVAFVALRTAWKDALIPERLRLH